MTLDSKTLNHATRAALLKSLTSDPANLAWSVRVLAPQDISASMLRHPPTNLNQQSQAATVSLIREVMASGVDLAEIYVDALGPSVPYQAYLSGLFPTVQITVCPKADSIYAIVSAASIAAKVTRDAWIENWMFAEPGEWDTATGSGYPSGVCCYAVISIILVAPIVQQHSDNTRIQIRIQRPG